jgi:hypothetical protein
MADFCTNDFDCPDGFVCDSSRFICISSGVAGGTQFAGPDDTDIDFGGTESGGGGGGGTTPSRTTQYTVTVNAVATDGSNIPQAFIDYFSTPVQIKTVTSGTSVDIAAIPTSLDYRFTGWRDQDNTLISTEQFATITPSRNLNLRAIFATEQPVRQTIFTITVTANPSGASSPYVLYRFSPDQLARPTTVDVTPGDLVTLISNTPSSGFRFVGWQNSNGIIVSREVTYQFVPDRSETYIAVFELSVLPSPSPSPTPSPSPSPSPSPTPPPTTIPQEEFNIQVSTLGVGEGNTFNFTISAQNYIGPLYWKFEPTGQTRISDADFYLVANPVSAGGQILISNAIRSVTIPVGIVADNITEGPEQFIISVYRDSNYALRVTQTGIITINDTSIEIPCIQGVINTFCNECNRYEVFQYSDCSTEERLLETNSSICCPPQPPPPPPPTQLPPPPPQWRLCSDGQLKNGNPPSDYRGVQYTGLGGGICWEPAADVGFIPELGNLQYTYRRGSSQFPDSYQYQVENKSFGLSYQLTFETNFTYFDIQPRQISLAPRDKKPFTVSIKRDTIGEFADGQTNFSLNVTVTEV